MSNEELVEFQNDGEIVLGYGKTNSSEVAITELNGKVLIKEAKEITPEQQEADQLLAALPEDKPSPEDLASAKIERNLAAAKMIMNQLGGNAIRRVFLNVMAGEFSKKEYTPRTEAESKIAYHFNDCITLRAKVVFAQECENLAKVWAKEQEDLAKIEQMTQDALTPEAKQMIAESGDKVVIENKGE